MFEGIRSFECHNSAYAVGDLERIVEGLRVHRSNALNKRGGPVGPASFLLIGWRASQPDLAPELVTRGGFDHPDRPGAS